MIICRYVESKQISISYNITKKNWDMKERVGGLLISHDP